MVKYPKTRRTLIFCLPHKMQRDQKIKVANHLNKYTLKFYYVKFVLEMVVKWWRCFTFYFKCRSLSHNIHSFIICVVHIPPIPHSRRSLIQQHPSCSLHIYFGRNYINFVAHKRRPEGHPSHIWTIVMVTCIKSYGKDK